MSGQNMCLGCVCGQRLDVVVMAPTQKTLHAVAPHLAWIVKAERSLPIRIAAIAWRWRTEIALGLVVFVVWARRPAMWVRCGAWPSKGFSSVPCSLSGPREGLWCVTGGAASLGTGCGPVLCNSKQKTALVVCRSFCGCAPPQSVRKQR